jgi:hypothetical protein
VAVLSGPNIAEEIAAGLPAAAVIASDDDRLAVMLQLAVTSAIFRVYVNDDLTGVELCAAAKNVIALAAGGVDGLGLGDNAKAALITRGLVEMARLGEACGGRSETFSGLAGMGDLIVTCWHPSGRNRRAGELIARGATAAQAVAEIGQTVEGLTTAPVLRDLSQRLGIEMPITNGVCAVLGGNVPLGDLVVRLARHGDDDLVDIARRSVERHGFVGALVDLLEIARVAARLGDCRRLLRGVAAEHDVVASLEQDVRERRPPRARAGDEKSHVRLTKSIDTGTPSSSKRSRSAFSTQ